MIMLYQAHTQGIIHNKYKYHQIPSLTQYSGVSCCEIEPIRYTGRACILTYKISLMRIFISWETHIPNFIFLMRCIWGNELGIAEKHLLHVPGSLSKPLLTYMRQQNREQLLLRASHPQSCSVDFRLVNYTAKKANLVSHRGKKADHLSRL